MCCLEKKRKDSLLNGVEEKNKNFKYGKIRINEKNSKQRIRYRFPKNEIVDQLENVFVFYLETCSDQEFAEANAAGLYDVNHLRNRWNRGLTPDELVIERENVTSVINKSNFADLRHIWEKSLKLIELCLPFIYARHSMKMQKMSGFGIRDCLTEASLGWKCFGT